MQFRFCRVLAAASRAGADIIASLTCALQSDRLILICDDGNVTIFAVVTGGRTGRADSSSEPLWRRAGQGFCAARAGDWQPTQRSGQHALLPARPPRLHRQSDLETGFISGCEKSIDQERWDVQHRSMPDLGLRFRFSTHMIMQGSRRRARGCCCCCCRCGKAAAVALCLASSQCSAATACGAAPHSRQDTCSWSTHVRAGSESSITDEEVSCSFVSVNIFSDSPRGLIIQDTAALVSLATGALLPHAGGSLSAAAAWKKLKGAALATAGRLVPIPLTSLSSLAEVTTTHLTMDSCGWHRLQLTLHACLIRRAQPH